MQPILPITVPIKTIKGATHQCYGGGDGVVGCEQTFTQEVAGSNNTSTLIKNTYVTELATEAFRETSID